MYTLITFATRWGSKYGGINSFNTDFLEAFGDAYCQHVRIICIASSASAQDIEKARNSHVTLLPLPYPPQDKIFAKDQAAAGISLLKQQGIAFVPAQTIWLGHDRITGAAAVEAARMAGGRSALIHHMSYDHYEAFAEDSGTAYVKRQEQRKLFEQADLVLSIGPLLRDAAHDLTGGEKPVHMLVPGLAEIDARSAPKTFSAFMSGRLDANAARIKQGHLGIAAFAHAHKQACEQNMPDSLCKQPKLMLRGVDFAAEVTESTGINPETELKLFAEKYAGRAFNLQALPYTEDRAELYGNLSGSSVAMMPSWHEGFGLVAWEAIAAGVPLVVSKHSGVYQLLEESFPGSGTGCVYPIDVRGSSAEPFFREEDLLAVADVLKKIAHDPDTARKKAATLRSMLLERYRWPMCVQEAAKAFGWELRIGSPVEPKAIALAITEPRPVQGNLPVHMPESRLQSGGILSDSQLLRAEEALVPFDAARQPDLDQLDAWIDEPEHPIAVRLLAGAGGLGKTRLALELCRQRNAAGWYAGFLDSELETKQLAQGWKALRALNQPLLIVIDYAETRQEALLALVKAMQQTRPASPVRLLLLARDGGEWWDNLPRKNRDCEALLGGYATSGPYHLPPLHEKAQDRLGAYRQALRAFAQALDVPAPDTAPVLEAEHFSRPLYLQMAALLALRGERSATAQGLTRALLWHEQRYWEGLFGGQDISEPDRHAEQLLALTTLAGGFVTYKAAWTHWKETYGDVLSAAQFKQLFHALIPLYPGKQGLQSVRPDLLGEALVARALSRPDAGDLLDAVLGKNASQSMRLHALTVTARLSDHYEELHEILIEALARHFIHCWQEFIVVATETPSSLPALAEAAFVQLPIRIRSQVAELLKRPAQRESVQLAKFYCLVNESLVAKAERKYQERIHDIEALNGYAASLGNFANALGRAGDREKAMEFTRQVFEIFYRLAASDSDRFEPNYAVSLGNYSSQLGESGRTEEALEHARQALEIDERLAKKSPDRFEPNYATSLSNYANRLAGAGRTDEALEHARQALEIRERLAKKSPDRFDPDYAASLSNYAVRLGDAGRNDEALAYALQALEIYERLAKKNPDRFDPDYALSLNNYANRLGDAGRTEKALEHACQALEIRERLAQKRPDRFDPDYATSLHNYAIRLGEAGRTEEALEHGRQALKIYHRLVKKNPARFAESQFLSACNVYFLSWLASGSAISELPPVPETAPPHRRPLLQLYAGVVQACYATDAARRADAFKQAVLLWNELSRANQTSAVDYWLCTAAWCAVHEPAAVAGMDWQTDWQTFRSQRQGNIPHWMLEVARRMDFTWPE